MRFKSRALVVAPLFAALSSAIIASLSPASADTRLVARLSDAPRADISWSELRKPKPATFKHLRSQLDTADAFATLYALQNALTNVADGQTYVWGRPKRQLRTLITPTTSFRGADGRVCRKLIVTIALGDHLKRTETTACRGDDKSWQLEG